MKKIAILGGGSGAFAAAADLTLAGHRVTLCADERHKARIEEVLESKTIKLTGVGRNGDAMLYDVTTDIEKAFSDVDVIMPVIPAYTQAEVARIMAPHIKSGHNIILAPGSTGGALLTAKILNDMGKLDGVKIAEMHTLPYAARKTSPSSANILLECTKLYFASFPAKYNEQMYELVSDIYPSCELVTDVLETSLNNGNPVSHPAPVVLNAGKIEYFKGEHYHYREGITPSVARVNERVDEERQEICKAFGYKVIDIKDRLYAMGYAPKRETLYECYRDSDAFNPLKGPKDLNDRYLTEDTPYAMVLLSSIAKQVGVETPVMDSVVTLASALKDQDYWEGGRRVEHIGIDGMNVEQIKKFLHNGYEA